MPIFTCKEEIWDISLTYRKSVYYSKEKIHFTVNNGIFAPKHWSGLYYNEGKPIPVFPTEPECIIRQRIGALKNQNDTWYDVYNESKVDDLIMEMKNNLNIYILPFFSSISNYDQLLEFLDGWILVPSLERLIVLGQLGYVERSKIEYDNLLASTKNQSFKETIAEYGSRFKIV